MAGPVEVGSGARTVDCDKAEVVLLATGGVKTEGIGVEGREPDAEPPPPGRPATDEEELVRGGMAGGVSPGRRNDCLEADTGRSPPPPPGVASISVKTKRLPPPSAVMPVGVRAPVGVPPCPNPLSLLRLLRRSPLSSRTLRSSFASSNASREPYRSMATSSIERPSSSAASYVLLSFVIRHAEPDEPGAGEPLLSVEADSAAAAADEADAAFAGVPCQYALFSSREDWPIVSCCRAIAMSGMCTLGTFTVTRTYRRIDFFFRFLASPFRPERAK